MMQDLLFHTEKGITSAFEGSEFNREACHNIHCMKQSYTGRFLDSNWVLELTALFRCELRRRT